MLHAIFNMGPSNEASVRYLETSSFRDYSQSGEVFEQLLRFQCQLDESRGGWRICIVYTNEVISGIWRTNDAMSSLRSSGLDSLWHQSGCPTLPLPSLPTDLSNTTTRQRSSPQTTGLSALSRRDGDASDRPSSRDPSQDGLSLVGPSCPSTPSKPTTDRSLLLHRNR